MNCDTFLDEGVGLDDAFRPKVVEDGFNGIAGVNFGFAVFISDSRFLEDVGESQRRRQLLVELDFMNAVQDVIFQRDNA